MFDKRLRALGARRDKNNVALANHTARINEELGTPAVDKLVTNVISESTGSKKPFITRAKLRQNKLNDRRSNNQTRLVESVTAIVMDAVPLDNDARENFGTLITENTKDFINSLFEDNIIDVSAFTKNPAAIIRDLSYNLLNECGDEEVVAGEKTIAGVINTKTKKTIIDEIKNAKKFEDFKAEAKELSQDAGNDPLREDNEPSIPMLLQGKKVDNYKAGIEATPSNKAPDITNADVLHSASKANECNNDKGMTRGNMVSPTVSPVNDVCATNEGMNKILSGNLGLTRPRKRKQDSTFGKLMRKSLRKLSEDASLSEDERMDQALGNAAVQYTILEALNTMNLVNESNMSVIIDRLTA